MACEHFEEGRMTRCRAVAGTLIPSHYEREHYCRTDDSQSCPTLRLYTIRQRPLAQGEYYALWMPVPPAHPRPPVEHEPAASPPPLM